MREKYGVGRDFDEVLITTGAQQVMELAAKVLCNPGDVILCEDPSLSVPSTASAPSARDLSACPCSDGLMWTRSSRS